MDRRFDTKLRNDGLLKAVVDFKCLFALLCDETKTKMKLRQFIPSAFLI